MDEMVDILGQQVSVTDLYTQISFFYNVNNDGLYPTIIEKLTEGLKLLTVKIPWIAGKVENMKIKKFDDIPRLIVKDLRTDSTIPTMDEMRLAKFPMRMLDEEIFAPCKTIALNTLQDSPVFFLQANFIVNGIILTFNGNHQVMDMSGQGQIISFLSKVCNLKPLTSEEIEIVNSRNENVIKLLTDDEYEQSIKLEPKYHKPISQQVDDKVNGNNCQCTWVDFLFSNKSLQELKNIANKDITTPYISTDDVLSAFVWKYISKARRYRLAPTVISTFARAVNVRRYLDIPATYPGMIVTMTYNNQSIESLNELSLGLLSSKLRLGVDINTSTLGFDTRLFATKLKKMKNKSSLSSTSGIELPQSITLSSWAKIDTYSLDFNLGLGLPEAVRRPRFVPCESLIYFLPKMPNGEIVVVACLRNDDFDHLKEDTEFTNYAQIL